MGSKGITAAGPWLGGWNRVGQAEDVDAPRRLYYVAMTRAKHPLTLARLPGTNPFLNALGDVPAVLRRQSWCLHRSFDAIRRH